MNDDLFAAADRYIERHFVGHDAALDAALAASAAAGMPAIHVSPVLGRVLHVVARAMGARRVLEIGTLGGYSAICLARALPADGQLITLERDPSHAAVARANLARADLEPSVEVRVGPATALLGELQQEGGEPFDLVFIDADKESYPDYLSHSLSLTRSGGLIIADNVVRRAVAEEETEAEPEARAEGLAEAEEPRDNAARLGIQRFNALLAAEPRVVATLLPTAGSKGFDGLALAWVR